MDRKKKRLLGIGIFAAAAAWFLLVGWVVLDRFQLRRADAFQAMATKPSRDDGALPVLWEAPAFSALDQNGHLVTSKALEHHVWIADFIFTRCTTACPLISAKMLLLRKAITRPEIRFVSFSVDPEFDTPAVLSDYARRWNADDRWLLLSGKASDVQDIARGMKVPLERTPDPDNPILHTTFFFLVDPSGNLRGVYDSLDDDAVKRLVSDAEKLDGAPERASVRSSGPEVPMAASAEERGRALFNSVGCAACHADARVAPPLADVYGHVIRFEGDASAMADDTYLRESILDPNARVVAGYPSLMPSYRDHLSDGQLADLLVFMRSTAAAAKPIALSVANPTGAASATAAAAAKPSAETTPPSAEAQVTDPVCGMQVRGADASPHTQYKGKTYYFCSDLCRDRFSKTPEKYVPGG